MEQKDALELMLDFKKHGDLIEQSWITRLIAVNAALASAVGAILGWGPERADDPLVLSVLLAICAFSILVTVLLSGVTLRQHAWNNAHTGKVKMLQGDVPIFRDGDVNSGIRVPTAVWSLAIAASSLWSILLLYILCRWMSHL